MHLAAAVSWFLASDALGSTRRALVAMSKRLATVETLRSPDTTSPWTAESPDAAAALAASKPVSTKSSYARLKRCDAGAICWVEVDVAAVTTSAAALLSSAARSPRRDRASMMLHLTGGSFWMIAINNVQIKLHNQLTNSWVFWDRVFWCLNPDLGQQVIWMCILDNRVTHNNVTVSSTI